MAKISIIVPVYNPLEQYLRECLDSLVNQTFADIEIICIDNGSLGGCSAILQEYAARDFRVHVIKCIENQGAAGAVNLGIEQSSAEYFQIVDSDDYLSLDLCKKLSDVIENNHLDLVLFNAINMGASSGYEYLGGIDCALFNKVNKTDEVLDEIYRCTLQYWNKLYKKSIVLKHGNFLDMDLKYILCDVLFCTKQYIYAENIYMLSDLGYHYRVNNESGVVNKYNEVNCPYADAPFLLCEKLLTFSQSIDCPEKYKKYLYYIFMQHLFLAFVALKGFNGAALYQQLRGVFRNMDKRALQDNLYHPQLRFWFYTVKYVPYYWIVQLLKIKFKCKNKIVKYKIFNLTCYKRSMERFF